MPNTTNSVEMSSLQHWLATRRPVISGSGGSARLLSHSLAALSSISQCSCCACPHLSVLCLSTPVCSVLVHTCLFCACLRVSVLCLFCACLRVSVLYLFSACLRVSVLCLFTIQIRRCPDRIFLALIFMALLNKTLELNDHCCLVIAGSFVVWVQFISISNSVSLVPPPHLFCL